MDTTNPTTVLLHDHRDPISASIVDILSDWHSSGWISNLAFVSVAEVESKGGDIGNAVATKPGSTENGPEKQRIKDVLDNPNVRLVAIDPVGSDATWVQRRRGLKRAADRVNSALMHRHAAIDIVVMWHGGHWDPDALESWKGWDTVLVAPEESSSIEAPGISLYCSLDSPQKVSELASHAAAFTSSIVGLWSGIDKSPFDHSDDIDDVRMGRCVHRRVDASEIADRLRSMALDPRSLREPGTLHLSSRAEFDRRIAELKKKLRLVPPPPPKRRPEPVNVGGLAALKAFFVFMFAALRRAPRGMISGVAYRGKAALADKIQRATYGQNSAFLVTVGGVSAAKADISTEALSTVVDSLHDAVGDLDGLMPIESAVGISQQPFWSGVFDNTFALVSGAKQGEEGKPYQSDGKDRYSKVSEVAPRITGRWVPEGGTVADLPAEGVELYDMLEIRGARLVLDQLATSESAQTRDLAKRNIRSLGAATQPWREAFVGRVGEMLADTLLGHVGDLAGLIRDAQESSATDAKVAKLDQLRRKRRRLLTFISSAAAAAIVVAIVLHFTILSALSLLIALPVIVFVWLVSALVAFYSNWKKIFQLENELAETANRYEMILKRLPVAVENVRRMVRVYSQYLLWAKALSLFLNEPYGRPHERPHDFLGMVGAMPRSVTCGYYQVSDEGRANECVRKLTQNLGYSLSGLWSDFVRASHDLLVRLEPHYGSVQVDDILSESEVGEDSYLNTWMNLVGSQPNGVLQVSPAVAGELDRRQMGRILDHIEQTQPEGLDELRAAHTVRQVGDGGKPSSHRISPHDTPAAFNKEAFSYDGIQQRIGAADRAVYAVMSSSAIRSRATRQWLDEVDTAVTMTPQLTFGYLELKSVAGPDPSGSGIGSTNDGPDDPNLENLNFSGESTGDHGDPEDPDELGGLSL